ncbi:hypothetical protein [Fodinicola acaciae]|uniref:hypothetical protein n=1 Tax=Fodinicola acaciae TaxID=2681555 RepID=UPI0013D84A72|nr:hypothetical protein [Fodinicola acaciae]
MTAAADSEFTFLTASQAERLRTEARDAFSRHGVTTVVFAPYLQSDTHGTFPLLSLAQKCKEAPEDKWSQLIEEHVAALVANPLGSLTMERDELLAKAYLRLLPDDFSPDPDHFRYARPVSEGLVSAIAVDLPDTVQILDDGEVERVGLGALRSTARANLVNLPIDDYQVATRPDGTDIHLVNGSSMFVASKALVLPQLMEQVAGLRPPADGVLVAVPWRHHLAFHPILDRTVLTALNEMTPYAFAAYQDNAGALSPRLYWWKDGVLTNLTKIDHEAKSFEPAPPVELVDAIRRLVNG